MTVLDCKMMQHLCRVHFSMQLYARTQAPVPCHHATCTAATSSLGIGQVIKTKKSSAANRIPVLLYLFLSLTPSHRAPTPAPPNPYTSPACALAAAISLRMASTAASGKMRWVTAPVTGSRTRVATSTFSALGEVVSIALVSTFSAILSASGSTKSSLYSVFSVPIADWLLAPMAVAFQPLHRDGEGRECEY